MAMKLDELRHKQRVSYDSPFGPSTGVIYKFGNTYGVMDDDLPGASLTITSQEVLDGFNVRPISDDETPEVC